MIWPLNLLGFLARKFKLLQKKWLNIFQTKNWTSSQCAVQFLTMFEFSLSLECIFCPLKYQVMVLTGSEATRQSMETFLPLGTVKYMEVGDNWGAHANSARLKLWMWIPTSLRGPWHEGSTIRGTLLWVSHKRKLRSRQSQVHLKCNAQRPSKLDYVEQGVSSVSHV